MKRMAVFFGALALAGGSGVAGADRSATGIEARQSFDLAVPYAPSSVPVGNGTFLVHELHLTNFAPRTLIMKRVRLEEAATGRTLQDMTGEALLTRVGHVGPPPDNKLAIPPGGRSVVYIDAPIGGQVAPAAVRHLVSYTVKESADPAPGPLRGNIVSVDARQLPVLSPPLRGGPWVAVYDPGLERGHRRVFYAVGGRARLPGRFAVDWMPAGQRGGGAGESGLGAEVLAVADGMVASTRDGVAEPPAGAPRPRVGMADAAGNYVSISIGDGRFAFYEHLMPGLRVKPGDRVRRGQVIGRLGSTGQASRPHLHFHLADADSPLAAEGLPYRLEGGQTIGAYRSIAAFEASEPWLTGPTATSAPSFPAPNAIVEFENRR